MNANELSSRLERLERENRWMKRAPIETRRSDPPYGTLFDQTDTSPDSKPSVKMCEAAIPVTLLKVPGPHVIVWQARNVAGPLLGTPHTSNSST